MDTLDPGTRPLCHNLRAGTDVTERRANPLQPALGVRMTFVARPHTPSKNESTEGKLSKYLKNDPIGDSAHACRQKGGVPEEAEIGRTPIPF